MSSSEGSPQPDDQPPTSIDPYATLSLPPTASASDIKSAYRKLALRLHPDKAAPEDRDKAHKAFQDLAFAYAVLSDERRRRRYDTTGSTAESLLEDDGDFNWGDFFRAQFAEMVTTDKIDAAKLEYQGSEEEKADVLKYYERCKGNMDRLFSTVMFSDPLHDEERFRGIIDEALEKGELETYDAYTKETAKSKAARLKRAKKENTEAENEVKKRGGGGKRQKGAKGKGGGEADLAALIQQRNQSRATTFLDNLEAKYAGDTKEKGKGSKRVLDNEPDEEAFREMGRRKKKVVEAEEIEEDIEANKPRKSRTKKRTKTRT